VNFIQRLALQWGEKKKKKKKKKKLVDSSRLHVVEIARVA